MMFDPTAAFSDHPYRSTPAAAPEADDARVPYDGQTRMRLTISSGLAHARVVIDPAARDLLAIEHGDGPRPRIRLAAGELAVSWRPQPGSWLRSMLAPRFDDVAIILHPAVTWTIAIRGGLSGVELDLAAGAIARLDIAGGCSDVLLDLPAAAAVVPIRISGGASHLGVRRPAETGVGLGVAGGVAALRLDHRSFGAIGGATQLDTGEVGPGAPHYELTIAGGASDLAIERR